MESYSVYCDESCHLEHDPHRVMVLGALWCPTVRVPSLNRRIADLKRRYRFHPSLEFKWTKISPACLDPYIALLDLFFDEPDLHFRTVVIPDKTQLRHADFGQTHDDWYYKMHYHLLKAIVRPHDRFQIYLDLKDTHGARKAERLRTYLCNAKYDFEHTIIRRIQCVRSHEVQLLQLADILIGCISYANRAPNTSPAKMAMVEHFRGLSGYSLSRSTLLMEMKTNIFRWESQG